MFRSLETGITSDIAVTVDGEPRQAHAGETVLALLLRIGVQPFRHTQVSGVPRGPYCAMGVCFDCLVDVAGLGVRPACLLPVSPGMAIRRLLRDDPP